MKNIWLWLAVAIVLVGGYFIFFSKSQDVTAEKTVIGVIGPFSGPAASMGEAIRNSINLVDANAVTFDFQDDECEAKKAIAAYQLLQGKGVKVFYVACSGSVIALAPMAKENGDVILTAYAGSTEIRKSGKETIRFNPDGLSVIGVMTDYLAASPFEKYGILYEKQDYAQSVVDGLKAVLGNKVITEEGYLSSSTSFKTQIAKLKASGADAVIFVPVSDVTAKIIYKEMQDLKIGKPIVGEVNACDYAFKPSDYGLKGVCWKAGVETQGYKDFAAAFKVKYSTEPAYPLYDSFTYDSMLITNRLLVGKGKLDNAAVQALEDEIIKGQKGSVVDFTFDKDGEVVASDYLKLVEFK